VGYTFNALPGDSFVMGRNPFWPMLERTPEPALRFGRLEFRGKRPELEALIGECLMAWPQVDAELGLFFGQLLAMPSASMVAVFQTLRRSSNQRDAIATAADITLKDSADDRLLVYSLLDVHKSIEAERNAIAHGHYGICDLHPDILVWMNTETYIDYHMMFLTGAWIKATREKEGNEFARRLFYYRNSDLERLLKDIDYLSKMWVDAINWLRSPMDIPGPFARETKYRQLCDQPRIAEALQIRRQKNS